MRALSRRPLPGVRFDEAPLAVREALPRMDIAVFVGFAASGPLHTPIAIADPADFGRAFGEDALLAWDARRGHPAKAFLAPAVRAFFANGGRRCWVVRIAGEHIRTNRFPIPGLLALDDAGRLAPAFARARAAGSWSDRLVIRAALGARPLPGARVRDAGREIRVPATGSPQPATGDCLRLVDPAMGRVLVASIARVRSELSSTGTTEFVVTTDARAWFANARGDASPAADQPVSVSWTRSFAETGALNSGEASLRDGEIAVESPVLAEIVWSEADQDTLAIDLQTNIEDAPATGTMLRIDPIAAESLGSIWLTVTSIAMHERGSPPRAVVRVRGPAMEAMSSPPDDLAANLVLDAQLLSLDIVVADEQGHTSFARELGLTPAHPRFWARLPDDDEIHNALAAISMHASQSAPTDALPGLGYTDSGERFPLAGLDRGAMLFAPIGTSVAFDIPSGRVATPGTPLERDGLAEFDVSLFCDPELVDVDTDHLADEADRIRYLADLPRSLRGIHAALGFRDKAVSDEATLVAVPDAAHLGWTAPARGPGVTALRMPEPAQAEAPITPCTAFQDCAAVDLAAPEIQFETLADEGAFALDWTRDAHAVAYRLEESASLTFDAASSVDVAPDRAHVRLVRQPGTYYFRLRAEAGDYTGKWSAPLEVTVRAAARISLKEPDDYSPDVLIAVHRALLRMCAGRAELFAVLGVPAHYNERDVIAHAATLQTFSERGAGVAGVSALYRGEARALSYGALYHPWLVSRDRGDEPQVYPPEGAVLGSYATRAIEQGGWIAPANEILRNVVALTPLLAEAAWSDLQDAQVNVIRQAPRGFLALAADTLSEDPDLRPINVRRLLILLRRLALRRGARFVFEPYGDALRRLVQRSFELTLTDLFDRGAFAGATAASSFRVVTDDTVNPPQAREHGRFVVELQVAPAQPLTFLTLRLTQTGNQVAAVEV